MKKLIVIMMMVLVTGFLSAQELRFDGYLNTGIGVVSKEDADGDYEHLLKAYAADAGHNGYRFRLNGSYTNEAKDAGIRFRFQSQASLSSVSTTTGGVTIPQNPDFTGGPTTYPVSASSSTATEYISLPYAFGWVSFFENKVNLSAGIIEDSTWTTGDFWLASDSVSNYAGLGALLKLTPIDGLTLGFGAHTIGRRGGSNNNTLARGSLGTTIDMEDARYTIHAVYNMKDVFRFDFSYRTGSLIGADETSRIFADFRLLTVKDLTAVFAMSLNRLEDFDDLGEMIFFRNYII